MINEGMFTSRTDQWATPQDFFNELNKEFQFTLDPCATHENAKSEKYYTEEENGLIQDWNGETVFCNPPYGREISKWVKKCSETEGTVVALLPARTDTRWFHDFIYGKAQIRFIKGRLKFSGNKWNAPFPNMVVIWGYERG